VEGTGTVTAPTTTGITWNLTVGLTAGWLEFDVTAYVNAQKAAGAAKVSFAFTSSTASDEGPTVFNTKDNASNKPLVLISSK
jgi:hypothetical protein